MTSLETKDMHMPLNQDQVAVELSTESLVNAVENLSNRDALQYLYGQAYRNVLTALDQLNRIVEQSTHHD